MSRLTVTQFCVCGYVIQFRCKWMSRLIAACRRISATNDVTAVNAFLEPASHYGMFGRRELGIFFALRPQHCEMDNVSGEPYEYLMFKVHGESRKLHECLPLRFAERARDSKVERGQKQRVNNIFSLCLICHKSFNPYFLAPGFYAFSPRSRSSMAVDSSSIVQSLSSLPIHEVLDSY